MADDLGLGDLACYGNQLISTPNLDAMAGLRFTQAYAPSSQCANSRYGILTGKTTEHQPTLGNWANLTFDDYTIFDALRARGYQTACVGKWGCDNTPMHWMDYFFGYLSTANAHNYYPVYLQENNNQVATNGVYAPDLIQQKALSFIQSATEPYFLYLAYNLPHVNNEANELQIPSQGIYADKPWPDGEKNYCAMVSLIDTYVGQILQAAPNAQIWFCSDNGGSSSGGHQVQFTNSNAGLRGEKMTLYEGGIRIPLIVKGLGQPGVSNKMVCLSDFGATIVGQLGDGIPMLFTSEQHPYLYFGQQGDYNGPINEAVRLGKWKGIRHTMGPIELYDLSVDPFETVDVAGSHLDIVEQVGRIMMTVCVEPKHCELVPMMFAAGQNVE